MGGQPASGPGLPASLVSSPPATAVIRQPGLRAAGALPPQRSTAGTPLCSVAPSSGLVSHEPSGFCPGHDGGRRLASSSPLGLWAGPLPSGPLGAVLNVSQEALCRPLPGAGPVPHTLAGVLGKRDGTTCVHGGHTHGGGRSAWGGGAGASAWVQMGPRGERGALSLQTSHQPTPQPEPGTAPPPGGCGLQRAEPHSHPPRKAVGQDVSLARLHAPGPASVSPRRPRPPGARLHPCDPPEFNPSTRGRCGTRMDRARDGFAEGPRATPLGVLQVGGTGLPPVLSP